MLIFKYLGGTIGVDRDMEEVTHRVCEGRKIWQTIGKWWEETVISRYIKMVLYEKVMIPTMMYGSETWGLNAQEMINN